MGRPLGAIRLDGPQGEPAALRLDAVRGALWLVLQSQFYAVAADAAQVVGEFRLPRAHSASALDSDLGLLWVAANDTLRALDTNASTVHSVRLSGVKKITAMAYSPALRQLWVIADDGLHRLTPEGQPALAVTPHPWFDGVHRIVSDGGDGMWAADRSTLAHLDRDGIIGFSLSPFDAAKERIIDLAPDPADRSVWVAGTRKVLHLSTDGVLLAQGGPAGSGRATRLIEGLFLEVGTLRLEFTSPAEGSFLADSSPAFALRIEGIGFDPDSLQFTSDTSVIGMDCEVQDEVATCTPVSPFEDGTHILDATIANAQGQRSAPARVQFTVDTAAPTIEILAPQDGLLTNKPQLAVNGRLSEPAMLRLNGQAVAVAADLTFSAPNVPLLEGSNALRFVANDVAGNTGEATLGVVLDTIAPPPANEESLEFQLLEGGTVRVIGAAGSVEAGATVQVTNLSTGAQVTATTGPNGSFVAELAAMAGEQLRIVVRDGAGNVSASTDVEVVAPPGSEPLVLTVTSPINGAAIASDKVLVSGTFSGPANAGVSVNDSSAVLVPAGSGWTFYGEAQLEPGGNEIVVTASAPDGRTESRSIAVVSTDVAPFEIEATPTRGFTPLLVGFRVSDLQMRGIIQIAVDFDSDGTNDFVTADPAQPISFTYTGTGLRAATFTIFDAQGVGHIQSVHVVLPDRAVVDQTLRAIWAGLMSALAAGDREGALRLFPEDSRATYAGVFEALEPHMQQVLAEFSEIEEVQIGTESGTYALMTLSQGNPRVFLVEFILGNDGIWRINSL